MHIHDTFETFDAYLDAACGSSRMKRDRASRSTHRPEWYGSASFEQAVTLARCGWPEGRARVEQLVDALNTQIADRIIRPESSYGVCGDCIDMGRFVSGEPECFQTFTPSEQVAAGKSKRVLRVAFNCFVSAGVPADMVTVRGAAICALVEALERTGHRCEVVMAFAGGSRDKDCHEVITTVKRPDAPLQLDQLAFCLCHPSLFRRLQFAYLETLSPAVRAAFGAGSYYYTPAKTSESGDVVLDRMSLFDQQWRSPDVAKAWVLQTLREQGVAIGS